VNGNDHVFRCTLWIDSQSFCFSDPSGLPILLLFIFLGKAVSLEGSEDGIKQYIGIWDLSVLTERGDVWSVACSQIFFSIGITFGILTAFGSHCERNEPAVWNSCVVAIANSIFSFIAGFAVFAALGHLAWKEGKEVTDLPYSGFGLVFGTWPVVLNELPGGIHWVRLLFFDLFLLGLDSAFAFQEAFITVLKDTIYFEHVARWKIALGMSVIGFLFSMIYCTDAGLNFLDVIDFYINFVMLVVGFFEAFGSAWVYGMVDQIEVLGREAVCSYMVATFGAVFLGSGLWFGLDENALWGGFVGMILFYLAGLGVTGFFLSKRLAEDTEDKWTMKSMWWELTMGNILALRDRIQPVIGSVPFVWCLLMKHFIPQALIILFINLAQADNGIDGTPKFGNYGAYESRPFQALGMCCFFFALFLFVNGLIFPELYAPLALPQVKEAEEDHWSTPAAKNSASAEKEKGASDAEEREEEESPKGEDEVAVEAGAASEHSA
jgi:solute carrier family 6 GABA transporter-like protein 1